MLFNTILHCKMIKSQFSHTQTPLPGKGKELTKSQRPTGEDRLNSFMGRGDTW